MFIAGFSISAFGSFFVFHLLADSFIITSFEITTRGLLLIGFMTSLAIAEIVRFVLGKPFSIGIHRQTPRSWGHRLTGPLLWGIDTGISITTIRITPLSFAGILMVILGYGNKWIGLWYAAGFIGSLILATTWPPQKKLKKGIPLDVILILSKYPPAIRLAGVITVALTTIVILVTLLGTL